MAPTKTRVPAVDGWFTTDGDAPALLGSRCRTCGTYAFPRETFFCRNPACEGTEFDEVPLSRRGKVWSYTDARYQPPPPYVAADPYVPFCIAAVELAAEKMVVMGQVVPGVTRRRPHRRHRGRARRRRALRGRRPRVPGVEVAAGGGRIGEAQVPDDRRWPSSGWACTPGASGAATSSSTA